MMNNITRTAYLDSLPTYNNNSSVTNNNNKTKERQQTLWYYPLIQSIEYFYLQFLLVTTMYIMEPWERFLVLSILFLVISLVTYSAFIYIPFHIHNILQSTMSSLTDVSMD